MSTTIYTSPTPVSQEELQKIVADRHNSGKLQWSLVDFEALKPMVQVLEYGANKYSADNWAKGLPTREVCESLLRHITAYLAGQDNDPESELPEVGHILCNAMFLSHMHLFRPDMDTRRGKQKSSGENQVDVWEQIGSTGISGVRRKS